MKNKVIMFPDWRGQNPYQELLADGLKQNDFVCTFKNFTRHQYFAINASLKQEEKPDIVHFHWINQYIEPVFWSSNFFTLCARYLVIILDLFLLRLKGIKTVWTVHNLVSHESQNRSRELFARMIFARMCHVVVHSEGARAAVSKAYKVSEKKISVIPHGNYIGCYQHDESKTQALKKQLDLLDKDQVFLFLGNIRRYKGVNELVKNFTQTERPDFKLLIAGKTNNEEDVIWLTEQSKQDPRIKLSLGFIPDDEICSYLSLSSIMVLPFIDTLTSGSAVLAMSYGKAIMLPEKGKVFSFPEQGILYYSEQAGVISALKKSIAKDLTKMGASNLAFSQQLSWEYVTEKLVREVYK